MLLSERNSDVCFIFTDVTEYVTDTYVQGYYASNITDRPQENAGQ